VSTHTSHTACLYSGGREGVLMKALEGGDSDAWLIANVQVLYTGSVVLSSAWRDVVSSSVLDDRLHPGLELSRGQNPPPSSCLQTHIFEWKPALNFNPWAKFQTFRQMTPQFF